MKDNTKHKMVTKQTTLLEFFTRCNKTSVEIYRTENDDTFNRTVNVTELIAQLLNAKVVLKQLPTSILVKNNISNTNRQKAINCQKVSKDVKVNLTSGLIKRHCPNCERTVERARKMCPVCESPLVFKCIKCNKQYPKYVSLENHLRIKCCPKKILRCSECDYTTPIKSHLARHVTRIHANNPDKKLTSLTCSLCVEKSQYIWIARKHSALCWKRIYRIETEGAKVEDKSETSNCEDTQFTVVENNIDLLNTIKAHCPDCNEPVPEIAKSCPKSSCKASLHFQCQKCDKRCSSMHIMRCHLRSKCNSQLQCVLCDYGTSRRYLMASHLKRNHVAQDRQLERTCPKCGKACKNPSCLKEHARFCGREPEFVCKSCDYRTKYRQNLKKHCRKVHSAEIDDFRRND